MNRNRSDVGLRWMIDDWSSSGNYSTVTIPIEGITRNKNRVVRLCDLHPSEDIMNLKSGWFGMMVATAFALMGDAAVYAKVVTVATPAGGQAMAAKVDGKGTIHFVFDTKDGPYYCTSTDSGKTLGKPVSLVDRGSRKPGLEFITWDMAVDSKGSVHVVLGTNAWKLKLPKEEWGYMYVRKPAGAAAFEPVKNVNKRPSEGFSIAVADNGLVAAVWMADKLFANISKDGGATFGPTIEIGSGVNPCNCCTTSTTVAADGRLAILYREETNNERDMYLAMWDFEKNEATKSRISATPWKIDSCPMTYYTVARNEKGLVAAWPTKGEIYFAQLNADGTSKNPKEIKTPGASGMRSGVLALPANNGSTLVAWKKDDQLGWQLYDERGQPSGLPGNAASPGKGVAAVVVKNGDVVLFR